MKTEICAACEQRFDPRSGICSTITKAVKGDFLCMAWICPACTKAWVDSMLEEIEKKGKSDG